MIYLQDSINQNAELARDYLIDGPVDSGTLIVLAHGAGANMHHAFMQQLTQSLVAKGFAVYRFNFLYMQANMLDGKKRPPDRAPKLVQHLESVLADIQHKQQQGELNYKRIMLVGKSMGSRMMATLTSSLHQCEMPDTKAALDSVIGQVCLGYPFVPIKGGVPRLPPLNESSMPTLVLQGERDKFGLPEQIASWTFRKGIEFTYIPDGDHSFAPRKSSGTTFDANLALVVAEIDRFCGSLS
ncbi:dienelactone hydrolase [Shewanella aestuarii]|uniref:Dienelactone hydrolase n=1 Tax=Shewanella aestuarii TaxID=1028752 RepID=A0ABT0L314_9GAMM|nr:alpha/beta family hydrolase [Shewanella aestuarii]MCL1117817.1 dienelactone hydrolase [Shewanella aestuarii]GGN77202.1 dienelactone hydrolase [Shewanella aestuarii]